MTIFIRKLVKNSQNWGFWLQKSSKFDENSKFNNYSLVPQIDRPVALCKETIHMKANMIHALGMRTCVFFSRESSDRKSCFHRESAIGAHGGGEKLGAGVSVIDPTKYRHAKPN